MTKSAMPQVGSGLEDTKHLFIQWRWCVQLRLQRIETTLTSPFEECSPHHLFFNRKMVGMKFKECIVIFNKTMD